MNKKIIQNDLYEILEFVNKVYSAIEVCAKSCAYNDDSACEEILLEAQTRQLKIIEKLYSLEEKLIIEGK